MSRYAITFTTGGFERADTIIVEAVSADVVENNLFSIFESLGYEELDFEDVIKNKSYYIRNCDDVDYTL